MTEQKKLNTHIETQLLHNDRWAGIAHSASHQPVYKSVQFTYDSAQGIAGAAEAKYTLFAPDSRASATIS